MHNAVKRQHKQVWMLNRYPTLLMHSAYTGEYYITDSLDIPPSFFLWVHVHAHRLSVEMYTNGITIYCSTPTNTLPQRL